METKTYHCRMQDGDPTKFTPIHAVSPRQAAALYKARVEPTGGKPSNIVVAEAVEDEWFVFTWDLEIGPPLWSKD